MIEEPILKFFEYKHLPIKLRDISMPFCNLAAAMVSELPPGDERSMALKHLLESKDCAVRAAL